MDSRYEEAFFMGHIEGSASLPFSNVLNPDKTFKQPEEINRIVSEVTGLDPNDKESEIILSC